MGAIVDRMHCLPGWRKRSILCLSVLGSSVDSTPLPSQVLHQQQIGHCTYAL